MLFDTDIIIWTEKGNQKAAKLIETQDYHYISAQTYMELLQCAPSLTHIKKTKSFLKEFNFITLPLTQDISHRASVYIEEYSLSSGIRAGDALIAATAIENDLPLTSSNIKHYKSIKNLQFHPLRV